MPRLRGLGLRREPEPVEDDQALKLGRTNSDTGKTGPRRDVAVADGIRAKAVRAATSVQLHEPAPEIGQFQRHVGTIEVGGTSAGLAFDALKNFSRCCLTIGGQAAESELMLSEVEEFSEGVVRKFPRSLTKFETCSLSQRTSV